MALVVYQGPSESLIPDSVSGGIYSAGESHESTERFVGLSNQGATCYLNGLLQTLFMTPEFRRAIFTWNYDPAKHGKEEWCITLQLQRLFGQLQLSKQRAVDTVALTHSFGWEGSEVFQQQDVQELTRVLFDALEETFKGTAVENIIDDLYAGELIDYLRCIDVDYESERVDKFLDFSLAIVPFGSDTPMRSLNECIEMYLRPEILDGDNKYYAEKFNMKVDAIKGLKFGKLPQIMSVQLKRFVYDFSGPMIVQKKLNDVVKFPMILDMNSYVGRRSHPKHGSRDEVENEEPLLSAERMSNEFEQFLVKQMELLKSGRSNGNNCTQISTYASPEDACEAESSVMNITEKTSKERVESDLEVVDLEASVKTEPITVATVEQDTKSGGKLEDDADSHLGYDSMTPEQVRELVETRGEWVYELYAVLIHSGVINGGHYYAYIKDLTTSKWWNFNDSTVTCIDEKTVQEAWGKKTSYYQYGSSYGGYFGTSLYGAGTSESLSTANAYMLMYRKVSLSQSRSSEGGSEEPSVYCSSDIISNDMVPQYIRDQVEEEERHELERRRLVEEERSKLNLRIYFNGCEHVIHTRRTCTYEAFLRQVWEELGVAEHLGESLQRYRKQKRELVKAVPVEDNVISKEGSTGSGSDNDPTSVADLSDGPCFDLFRLRNYNTFTQMKTESYDMDSAGDMTLEDLMFREHRTFLLETRSGDEEWEVYFVDGISVQVIEFDAASSSFKDPRSMRLRRTATLGDCRKMVSKWVAYPYDQIRLMKIVNCGYNDAQLDILINDDASLRDDLLLYDNYKLYVEDAGLGIESNAYVAFVAARNVVEIRINQPPAFEFDLTLKADLRWTIPKLRTEIKRVLGYPEDEDIRLFKQSLRGQELRDGSATLSINGIYNKIGIAVSKGQATPVGFYSVSFVEYVPMDYRVGVVELPLFDHENDGVVIGMEERYKNTESERYKNHYDDNPPPLIPLFSDNQSTDDNAEWNAVLDAVTDNDSNASNTGVADVDDLQQLDDDFNFATAESFACASDCVEGEPVPTDASIVACPEFDKGAAEVAKNYDPGNLNASLQCSYTDGSHRSSGADDPYGMEVGTAMEKGTNISVCAIPVVNDKNGEIPTTLTPRISASVSATASCTASNSSLASNHVDVQPSDFGEKLVSNMQSANNFIASDQIGNIFVQNSTTFLEVKSRIIEKLIESGRLREGSSPYRIRIRDKVGNSPGKILSGEETFGDSQVYLYDHKVFAFQVLEHDENLPVQESGNIVALVQRWNRSEWRLEDRFEVLLRGSSTVRSMARGLCGLTGIPFDSMQAMVLSKDSEFLLSDLNLKSPPRSYGRSWFDPTKETRLLRATLHDMRLTDGDVLLLQDTSEPLKQLSPADLKSVDLMRIASGDNEIDFWSASNVSSQTSSSRNPFGSNGHLPGAIGPSTMSARRGYGSSNGVHIRSQKDRQQEESDRSINTTAAMNGDVSVDPSGVVTPATMEACEKEYDENNIDDREFHRQGGMALFSDIN